MFNGNPIIDLSPLLQPGEEAIIMYPIPNVIDVIPNTYFITSYGRVFSIANYTRNWNNIVELSQSDTLDGYPFVGINGFNKRYSYRVNRLVAIYFIPNPENKPEVNHKDKNHHNNHVDNLEWMTHEEQMKYESLMNENAGIAALVAEELVKTRGSNVTLDQIAKKYNVNTSFVRHIRAGDTYRAVVKYTPEEMGAYTALDRETVLNVYKLAAEGVPDEKLAEIYNKSVSTIRAIRRVQFPYNETLAPYGFKPIIYAKENKLSERMAVNAYNDFKDRHMTVNEVCKKYSIGASLATDIKYCRNTYSYLQSRYGLNPLSGEDKDTKLQLALQINHEAQTKPLKELMAKYKIGESKLLDIKFCRNAYKDLVNMGGIIPDMKNVNKQASRFTKEEAIAIRECYANTNMSEVQLAKKFNASRHTIHEILAGINHYDYFSSMYDIY